MEIQTVFNEDLDVEKEQKEAGIEIIVPDEDDLETVELEVDEKGQVDINA